MTTRHQVQQPKRPRAKPPTRDEMSPGLIFAEHEARRFEGEGNQVHAERVATEIVADLGQGEAGDQAASLVTRFLGRFGDEVGTIALRRALSGPKGGHPTAVQDRARRSLKPFLARGRGQRYPDATEARNRLWLAVHDEWIRRGRDMTDALDFLSMNYGSATTREVIQKTLARALKEREAKYSTDC